MSDAYENAVVFVSGASTGLGRAIACGVAQAGASAVIINYAGNTEQAEATAEKVQALGARAILAQGNVADDADCHRIVESAQSLGRIDALFNNAAISCDGSFDSYTADDFLSDYQVNVVGPFQLTRAARSLLEASNRAAVVNTSSMAGVDGYGSSPSYTASKGALITLGQWMARQLAPKIRVNTICPGFIDTEWFEKQPPPGGVEALRNHIRQSNALQIVSGPEDIAEVALFLGSPASKHMTGEMLKINGGSAVKTFRQQAGE